jgi:hypothetical protein
MHKSITPEAEARVYWTMVWVHKEPSSHSFEVWTERAQLRPRQKSVHER